MKSFVIEQILLVKKSLNYKFGNKKQLQEKSNEKYLTEEICHLREENKIKSCVIIQTPMENQNHILKRIKSIDGNHSEIFSTQHAQSDNFIPSKHYVKIVILVKVLRLRHKEQVPISRNRNCWAIKQQ